MDEEEESGDIQDVIRRLDDLTRQVGVINSNVSELTAMAQGMNQSINMINHNLMAYFHSQNFFPPPYPP